MLLLRIKLIRFFYDLFRIAAAAAAKAKDSGAVVVSMPAASATAVAAAAAKTDAVAMPAAPKKMTRRSVKFHRH